MWIWINYLYYRQDIYSNSFMIWNLTCWILRNRPYPFRSFRISIYNNSPTPVGSFF